MTEATTQGTKVEKPRCDCLKCEMRKLISKHMVENGLATKTGEDDFGQDIIEVHDLDYLANAILPINIDFLITQDAETIQSFFNAILEGVRQAGGMIEFSDRRGASIH